MGWYRDLPAFLNPEENFPVFAVNDTAKSIKLPIVFYLLKYLTEYSLHLLWTLFLFRTVIPKIHHKH